MENIQKKEFVHFFLLQFSQFNVTSF